MIAMARIAATARALGRLLALGAVSAPLYAALLAGRAALGVDSERRRSLRRRVVRFWARSTAAILGMRLDVRGEAPAPPYALVANHLGYVDVLALAATADCVFVAKRDVARWPVVGALCKAADVVFVDRGRRSDVVRVNRLLDETVRRGDGIVVFPEGTSTPGVTVLELKPSLLDFAARADVPVRWAAVSYLTYPPDPPAHLSVCWWGEMTFPGHFLALLGMSGFVARITYGAEVVESGDRKRLARALHARILQAFEPVVRPAALDAAAGRVEGSNKDVYGELATSRDGLPCALQPGRAADA
jgi:1-acyl-sn-glycerol-3-phosphate acyltransferase